MRLLPLLFLLACSAQHALREGADLAAQGHPYAAAQRYLEVLDQRPGMAMAQQGLAVVAEDAYRERLNEARAHEARGEWDEAVAVYAELDTLLKRLRERDAVDFPTVDVSSRVATTENRAADEAYTRALNAEAEGRWRDAVAAWTSATEYVPGFRDAESRRHAAEFHWGEAEQKAGAWRDAADHFATAGAGTWGDGNRRAASIYAALGNAGVWAGTCRQATRDLRAARDLIGAALVAEDLADAERCAVTTAVVLPFENPSGQAPAGLVLSEAAADGLAVALGKAGTEFLQLLERDAADAVKAEQAITAAKGGTTNGLTRAHYLVVGKLTQVKVVSSGPSTSSTPLIGQIPGFCKSTRADGSIAVDPCMRDVELRYLEHQGRREVRLAGTVRVIRSQTGEQVALAPFDVRKLVEVRWADGFTAGGKPARVVPEDTVGGQDPRVSAEILALSKADRTLPEEDDLVRAAIDAVAETTAREALKILDFEPTIRDPKSLEIVEL